MTTSSFAQNLVNLSILEDMSVHGGYPVGDYKGTFAICFTRCTLYAYFLSP